MIPDSALVFAYHLMWGAVISIVLALGWAKRVATQSTVVRDPMSSAQVITNKVDHGQFLRTWVLGTLSGSAVSLIILAAWETKKAMENMGLLG